MSNATEREIALNIVKGIRLGYASLHDRKGSTRNSKYYKRWEREQVKIIRKLLGVEMPTIWNNLKGSKRI